MAFHTDSEFKFKHYLTKEECAIIDKIAAIKKEYYSVFQKGNNFTSFVKWIFKL